MLKRFLTSLACIFALALCCLAQGKKSSPKAATDSPVPDKALMQKLLDGWSTLDPANVAAHYPQGPHTYFDIAPLKYNDWDEYAEGVKKLGANYQSFKMTLNDDAVVHQHGDLVWATATIKEDATLKSGKREMATFRWTIIWEKQGGRWLIVHEHTSEPME
jgi:ketosteroid isomerase-like protein